MKAVVDNDILIKGTCYGLLTEFAAVIPGNGTMGVLGASKFVVTHYLKEYISDSAAHVAEARFLTFLSKNEVVEPTPEEQQFAATLESAAQKLSLNLDIGESQLVAILIVRLLPWFISGDKRAIAALEHLITEDGHLASVAGKIICLEQVVKELLNGDSGALRRIICSEPNVDKTLTICFGCHNPEITSTKPCEALESYIADLRKKASKVLATL